MSAPTGIDRRVANLEAEAFRARDQHQGVRDRLDHLTAAVGDLSQDGHAVRLDVQEIRTELHEVNVKMDALTVEMRQGFDVANARFDEANARMDSLTTEMRQGFAMIAAVLEKRPG